MQTKTYNVYKFKELPQEVKAKVLEKYRNINVDYDGWYDCEYENWQGKLLELGYTDVEFSFSGFYSQGDGASFTANIDLMAWLRSHKKVKAYKPLVAEIQSGEISGHIVRSTSRYVHAWTCYAALDSNYSADEARGKLINNLEEEIEKERLELSQEFYRDLRKSYEVLTEDDSVIDTLEANDYNFTLKGEID